MDPTILRRVPLLAALPEEDLLHLAAAAEERLVPAGAVLIEEETPEDALYIIMEGAFEVAGGAAEPADCALMYEAGGYIGELALLHSAPAPATIRAVRESRLIQVGRPDFARLLDESPAARQAVLASTAARLRQAQSLAIQQERMAQLGAMSAGLVHDLNNPAAAIRRGIAHLTDRLAEMEQSGRQVGRLRLAPEEERVLDLLGEEMVQYRPPEKAGDLLARDRLERELEEWLEARGVARPWEIAPVLVDRGWTLPELEGLTGRLPAAVQPAVVAWLCRGSAVTTLLGEIVAGAEQLAQIVRAIKTYTHQEPHTTGPVDVHEGLEHALTIMRHRLGSRIRVVREYAEGLPAIEANAGELTRVWINLIDNAVAAMQGEGTLRLRSQLSANAVRIEIIDDGPGIPVELQARLFDPFFTTKAPGDGTGLGLHNVHRIVVQKHHGQIHVVSMPGATHFNVTLPLAGSGRGVGTHE